MKFLMIAFLGFPYTVIVCFLFSGGVEPVENHIYSALSNSYGYDLLIWVPICFLVGWMILDTVGFETEN